MSNHGRDDLVSNGFGKDACLLEEDEKLSEETRTHPLFAELLLNMIDELPDDVVSWSLTGESFVIKKVPVFEGALPSYYSHGNFTSFVRQLNNYGFQRTRRTPPRSLSSTVGGEKGTGAVAAATTRALTWEEFSHPLFHRGRRDLLVGIHRRRKKGARLRPEPVDTRELSMLTSLRAGVGALSGDLRTVNGKLESIMSLLSVVTSGQIHPAAININHGAAVDAGDGGPGFEGGKVVDSTVTPAAVVRGGKDGFGERACGWDRESDGGMGRGVQILDMAGAPPGHFVGRYFPVDRQHQGAANHNQLHPPPYQTPSSTQRYPVGPDQVRSDEALPPSAEEKAARSSESTLAGTFNQQLPPQQYQPAPHIGRPPEQRGAPFF